MTRRPTRRIKAVAPPPAPAAVVSPEAVTLDFDADAVVPSETALLIDGTLIAMAPVDGGTSRLPLPAWAFGQRATVVAVPDGRLLGAAIELGRRRFISGLQLEYQQGCILGRFEVSGDLAPAASVPLPVCVVQDGEAATPVFALCGEDGGYRFSAPLLRLPAFDIPLLLTLRIAGTDCATELAVTHAEAGLLGYVEPVDEPFVRGWIVDTAQPNRRVAVEVEVAGEVIWSGLAELERDDVRALGVSDGCSGFQVALPSRIRRAAPLPITVRVAGTPTHLVKSPYTLPALPPFLGFFDVLQGAFAGGWAVNMHDPEKPLQVEAICEGEVIGSGVANVYRGDVKDAGLPTARCGFHFILDRPVADLFERDVIVRVVGADYVLPNSPQQVSKNTNIGRFLTRRSFVSDRVLPRLQRHMVHAARGVTISILMPVYNTPQDWLMEALNSVLGQWSPLWELICVDDGSTAPHVAEILAAAARHDSRIRVMRSPGNMGIARTVNFALRAARGEYVAFMDHDDVLEPDAVHQLARAARRTDADLLYSDEAITTEDINSILDVRARPAFSYDFYLSHPYFVHLVCARTEVARSISGWDESLPISADVDFILRMIERSRVVTHVPGVLYRWRTHATSTGHSKQDMVMSTMLGILTRHLERQKLPATVQKGLNFNAFRIDWQDDGGEVLIVIPTKNRVDLLKTAIDSIERTSDGANYRIVVIDHESTDKATVRYLKAIAKRHTVMPYSGVFNYALMNNLAVRTHGGDARYILFMNNDVEAREQGWIPRMRSLAARQEVGAVGCLLLYGNDKVQHAGVLMGFNGAADHVMKLKDGYKEDGGRTLGYNCNLTVVRDYSAVTAACIMIRRDVFDAVEGFDESFVVGFNDTDLCLRIGAAGYKVLYDGYTVLYHHESATRTTTQEVLHPEDDARLRTRWARYFERGDRFYNPLLAAWGVDHTLREDRNCQGRMDPRVTTLTGPEVPTGKAAPRKRKQAGRRGVAV